MRYDLNILWVEDTEDYYRQNVEMLEMKAEDLGLKINFVYVQNAKEFLDRIKNLKLGFRLYDMLFVDYSLSHGVEGDTIIKELRNNELDADILFYSSQLEEEMRKKITGDLNAFQGVYIANREIFYESAVNLIQKNAKRLLSLKNIRGMLMDQTSENDYTITSYIMRRFKNLNDVQQQYICDMVKNSIVSHIGKSKHNQKELAKLEDNGITNINNILKMPNYLVPISLKYQIFGTMVDFLQEKAFPEHALEIYVSDIILKRNLLAHKKLEISGDQQYILGYDDIDQYQAAKSQNQNNQGDVTATGTKQISYVDWIALRKQVVNIGTCFDEIQKKLHAQDK